MFNGIIQGIGIVEDLNLKKNNFLKIKTKLNFKNFIKGSSVACDGICLTIVDCESINNHYVLSTNVSEETISKTTIQFWKNGKNVNIEKSLKFNQEISGHFVYGHVDGFSKVIKINKLLNSWYINFEYTSEKHKKLIVEKGSVSINGISLTVAKKNNDNFSIAVIPHTYKVTNLSTLQINDNANIEYDMLARYIFNK